MKILSIKKRGGIQDHNGAAHPPFRLVETTEGHALRMIQRSHWVKTEDDFLALLDTAPEKSVRQIARNAGLATTGDRKALRDRLVAHVRDEHGGEVHVDPVKKDDSEEAGPSDDAPLPAGAELDREEFAEELELKTVKELQAMAGDLELTKYGLSKAELIAQIVDYMAGVVEEEAADEG